MGATREKRHHHHVYVVELSDRVWNEARFRKANPEYELDPMWNDGNCTAEDGCTDLQGGGTFNLGAILYF